MNRGRWWVLLAWLALVARPAAADPVAEAKRLKDVAAEAFLRGDYAAALESFQSAYRIHPTPNLRYDVAVALSKMGRYDEAVEAFEDFLASAPDAPADARAYAQRQLRQFAALVGRLSVRVEPADAAVTIDGAELRRPEAVVLPGAHIVSAT